LRCPRSYHELQQLLKQTYPAEKFQVPQMLLLQETNRAIKTHRRNIFVLMLLACDCVIHANDTSEDASHVTYNSGQYSNCHEREDETKPPPTPMRRWNERKQDLPENRNEMKDIVFLCRCFGLPSVNQEC